MGSSIFLLLFLLGLILSLLGGVIGVVDAFKVNPGWGLLTLLVPFALLFFCIKFWERRRWARNSLILGLLGLLSMVIGMPFLQDLLSPQGATGEPAQVTIPAATGKSETFAKPMVPAAPSFAAIARANLIQSTNPDERRRLVNSSRPDPFATVPIPPLVTLKPSGTAPSQTTGKGSSVVALPVPPTPSRPTLEGAVKPKPSLNPSVTPAPGAGSSGGAALPPSAPLQSEQVEVTGVIALGGYSYAIVQSPEQPGGQYLKVGQRFGAANQILVKRIEMKGVEPIVVFEEKGREVKRFVGPGASV